MAVNEVLYFDDVDLTEGKGSVEVRDYGFDRYTCYFCAPKDSADFQTLGFNIIEHEGKAEFLPEKNGYLRQDQMKYIWEQIKGRFDKPDLIKKINSE